MMVLGMVSSPGTTSQSEGSVTEQPFSKSMVLWVGADEQAARMIIAKSTKRMFFISLRL